MTNEVLRVAFPLLSVPVPRTVEPSWNVTEPVGAPVAGGVAVTAAVKITLWPETDGFWDDETAVVDEPRFTVCSNAAEVLSVALPLLIVPVPRMLEPSLNVTVPVGVPVPGGAAVTLAVKVTV